LADRRSAGALCSPAAYSPQAVNAVSPIALESRRRAQPLRCMLVGAYPCGPWLTKEGREGGFQRHRVLAPPSGR
jgi:hypothetical protein